MNGTRARRLAAMAAGPFVILAIVAGSTLNEDADASQSGGSGEPSPTPTEVTVALDAGVNGNTATTLGPRDECVSVPAGEVVTVDVTITGVSAQNPLIGFSFWLSHPTSWHIVDWHSDLFLAAANGSDVTDNSGYYLMGSSWQSSAADVVAPESGSGVLQRLVLQTSPKTTPGFYKMRPDGVVLWHTNGESLAYRMLGAEIAIGLSCDHPRPTRTPIPSPRPPEPGPVRATVGIDHDGLSLDINDGPARVAPSETATVSVLSHSASSLMGAYDIQISYDPARLIAESCAPSAGGVCNPAAGRGEVLLSLVSLQGLPARARLMDVTFRAGDDPACVPLVVSVLTAGDTLGGPITTNVHNGMICVGDATPPPTPPPTIPPSQPPGTPHGTPIVISPGPLPSPGPAQANVGIDHNGGSPDVNPGPAFMDEGGSGTVSLVSQAPANLVGVYDIQVTFDRSIIAGQACSAYLGGICNPEAGEGKMLLSLANIAGLASSANVMDMTFLAVGPSGACSPLTLTVRTAANTSGSPITVQAHGGTICIGNGVSAPIPLPNVTPTVTPSPPSAPFPSPTPGGTAVPTPPPGGGPPVFYPGAVPMAAPALPVQSVAATAQPTATALGAAALPAAGGSSGASSVPLAAGLAAALLAVSAAIAADTWLRSRRTPR